MRGILFIVGLAGLATLHFSQAIPYVYDELLYTKSLWDEYKLDFPYALFKEEDESIARAKDSLSGLFIEDSLSGPQSNLQELIDQDLKRGEFQPNSFDVSLIDDKTPLPGAASVAQCKTCLALATVMWQGLVQWTHRHLASVPAHDLIPYGESLCEYEVPEAVLKEWVLLSARVHGRADHPAQQFYMLSVRHRQHARVREIQVVRAACKALLSDKHANALKEGRDLTTDDVFRMEASPLLEVVAKKQKEYLKELKQRGAIPLEKNLNTGSTSTLSTSSKKQEEDNRIPALDDDDEDKRKIVAAAVEESVDQSENENEPVNAPLPKVQRECFNKHPQCEYWAERGECKANPGYMVGTETTGWCRAACFVCPHPAPVPPGGSLDPTAIADLEKISKDLLDSVQTTGCTKSSPCRSIDGNAAARIRLASAAGVDPERTAALQKAALISGPIEAESGDNASGVVTIGGDGGDGGVAGVDAQLLVQSMVISVLSIDKAVVTKNSKDVSTDEILKKAPGKDANPVEKALWGDLAGQCLYTSTGWWSYEVCYFDSVTQFHMPAGQNVPQWVISLGQFASADWQIRNSTMKSQKVGLFPAGSVVPYVSQQLESGNICELTGESGVNSLEKDRDGDNDDDDVVESIMHSDDDESGSSEKKKKLKIGDQVLRKTLVRFMCSPDMTRHIAVVEPEQCRYVVDVYVPVLCRVEGMRPVLPEKGGGGGSSTARSAGKKSSRSAGHSMDVDFDDPYVDPDELEEIELKKKAKKEKFAGKDEL